MVFTFNKYLRYNDASSCVFYNFSNFSFSTFEKKG